MKKIHALLALCLIMTISTVFAQKRDTVRDMGFYDHTVGLYFDSKDGIHWGKPKIGWYGLNSYIQEPAPTAKLSRYGRLERPQLLIKNGKPAYLFNAAQGGTYGTASGFVFKIN
ncbi:MAG TPA: hypothetical protein VFP20_09020 [Bacteroidales bacterium]|nr:hypothetical protein [Bacteroidales bacterium]